MRRFAQGQRLFMVISNLTVHEVQLVRYDGSRCVVRYPSFSIERASVMCQRELPLLFEGSRGGSDPKAHAAGFAPIFKT